MKRTPYSLPGDPHLPPGFSIRHFDDSENCCHCGGQSELNLSACCRAPMSSDDRDAMVCPACQESCELLQCEVCHGSGVQEDNRESLQQWYEDKADAAREEERFQ